jgi:hypothetical protein
LQNQIHLIILQQLESERSQEELQQKQLVQEHYQLQEQKQLAILGLLEIVQRDHLQEEVLKLEVRILEEALEVHQDVATLEVHLDLPEAVVPEVVDQVDQEAVAPEVHLDLPEVVGQVDQEAAELEAVLLNLNLQVVVLEKEKTN